MPALSVVADPRKCRSVGVAGVPFPARTGRSVFALDGKTSRGARCSGGRAVHLFAAIDQGSGVVMGQCTVDVKTNGINAFGPLLDRFDIVDAIITADAPHTQRANADYLSGRGAHYILIVKSNQPSLYRDLRSVPWKQVPAADTTTDKGHGRVETRTVKLVQIPAGIAFPVPRWRSRSPAPADRLAAPESARRPCTRSPT